MSRTVMKIPLSRKLILLFLDVIAVLAASFGALFIRFEFRFSLIPEEFVQAYLKNLPFTIGFSAEVHAASHRVHPVDCHRLFCL